MPSKCSVCAQMLLVGFSVNRVCVCDPYQNFNAFLLHRGFVVGGLTHPDQRLHPERLQFLKESGVNITDNSNHAAFTLHVHKPPWSYLSKLAEL